LPNPKVMSLPAGLPPTLRNVTQSVPAPVQQITMASGTEAKKRGRPAGSTKNTMIPIAELNPTITQAPQIMSVSALKAPPSIGKLPVAPAPVKDAYTTASAVLDPWGTPLATSEHLEFILSATDEQQVEYGLSSELIAAAVVVKAGPVVAPTVVKPSLPKLPGQGVIAPAVAVQSEVSDLDTHRATLTKLLISLPVFKNPANIMQFLKLFFPEGNIRTVRQITEVGALTQIIEFVNQGNEAVATAIGV